jgi:hypothetical protein
MQVSTAEFRRAAIVLDGQPYAIVDFQTSSP